MGVLPGSSGAECRNGDGRLAFATCDVCGEAVCESCLRERGGERTVCGACAYGGAVGALEARRTAPPAEAEIVPERPPARRRLWPYAVIALAVVELIVFGAARANTVRPDRVVPSPGAQVRLSTVECIARLQALVRGTAAQRVCPLSGNPLAITAAGAACPDPLRHGLPTLEVDRDGHLR